MHIPVLLKEVLQYLGPKPNENFIDCTIGEAGHAMAIVGKTGPNGKVLGIDWDSEMISNSKFQVLNSKFKDRLVLINDSYANLKKIAEENKFYPVNGILLDLGMSSWHLEESGRGFSFLKDEPLGMKYNAKISNELTAERIINTFPQEELEKILREYGEERFARQIAKKIVQERKVKPIKTTFQLVEIIRGAIPARFRTGKIHFATKTFQALRIAVNNELDNLKIVLPQIIDILESQGKIVVISFHSIEDRLVKNFFKEESKTGRLNIITKKPIIPSEEEIKNNRRSRSAKLRSAIKI